ncbi:MAG: NAD(P)H-dependent oxidoreductase [Chloroflexota bacterium]
MNILSILAHPRSDSFCQAVFDTANATLADNGHSLVIHNLYKESFDPILKAEESYTIGLTVEEAFHQSDDPLILAHRRDIAQAEGLLMVHPNWWGKPPAILAGWLDRILVPGVAYRLASAQSLPEGLLVLERALIFNTSDTPAEREAVLGDPLNLIWRNCVLPFCGSPTIERHMFGPMASSTDDARRNWLNQVEDAVTRTFGVAS